MRYFEKLVVAYFFGPPCIWLIGLPNNDNELVASNKVVMYVDPRVGR